MRDPHVEALFFTVSSAAEISYQNPEALAFSHHLGEFSLNEGVLKIIPTEHFCSGEMASLAVEGFLRSWEIETDLKRNFEMIRFSYSHADLIDRDPPPLREPQFIYAEGVAALTFGASGSCHLVAKSYPSPPAKFTATELAKHAYRRWVGYKSGREPLQSMAYFILTLLERQAGTRAQACDLLKVDRALLNYLGNLSSEKGSAWTARKATATDYVELTESEVVWLERAVKRLILRLGEHASGPQLEQITLETLSGLSQS